MTKTESKLMEKDMSILMNPKISFEKDDIYYKLKNCDSNREKSVHKLVW